MWGFLSGDFYRWFFFVRGAYVRGAFFRKAFVLFPMNIYANLSVTKRTRNKCIRSAETHFSFGQFTHEEYVSMDATS